MTLSLKKRLARLQRAHSWATNEFLVWLHHAKNAIDWMIAPEGKYHIGEKWVELRPLIDACIDGWDIRIPRIFSASGPVSACGMIEPSAHDLVAELSRRILRRLVLEIDFRKQYEVSFNDRLPTIAQEYIQQQRFFDAKRENIADALRLVDINGKNKKLSDSVLARLEATIVSEYERASNTLKLLENSKPQLSGRTKKKQPQKRVPQKRFKASPCPKKNCGKKRFVKRKRNGRREFECECGHKTTEKIKVS